MSTAILSAVIVNAESDGPADRRLHPRHPRPPLEVNARGRLTVQDISQGGLCVASSEPLAVGSCWELILTDGIFFFTQTMTAIFGWEEAEVPDGFAAEWQRAEDLTDQATERDYAVLSADEAAAFVELTTGAGASVA